jgi:hypothetical protein
VFVTEENNAFSIKQPSLTAIFGKNILFTKRKSLKELTQGINFTSVLHAAFAPTVLRQSSTNVKLKHKKPALETYMRKSCA